MYKVYYGTMDVYLQVANVNPTFPRMRFEQLYLQLDKAVSGSTQTATSTTKAAEAGV